MSLSSQPNQKSPHSLGTGGAVLQIGVAKTTEGMSAGLGLAELDQDRTQRAPQNIRSRQSRVSQTHRNLPEAVRHTLCARAER